MSRKGVPNRKPAKSWVYDQLVEQKFDFMKEFVDLYGRSDDDRKAHLLSVIAEYCLPKQRPIDSDGDPGPAGFIDVTPAVSDAQLINLAKIARGDSDGG